MKKEILTAKNIYLENQSCMFLNIDKFNKSTFLLRLEGFWNGCKERTKIMEFIRKELETL